MDQMDLSVESYDVAASSLLSWKKLFLLAFRVTSIDDQETLIDEVMDGLIKITNAERGFLVLSDGNKGRVVAARNHLSQDIPDAVCELSWHVAKDVLLTGTSVITIDAMHEPRFSQFDSVRDLELKSICCLPLKTKQGNVCGAIYLDNRTMNNAFTGPYLEILEVFCKLAGQSLENLEILSDLKVQNEKLFKNCRRLASNNMQLGREKGALLAKISGREKDEEHANEEVVDSA